MVADDMGHHMDHKELHIRTEPHHTGDVQNHRGMGDHMLDNHTALVVPCGDHNEGVVVDKRVLEFLHILILSPTWLILDETVVVPAARLPVAVVDNLVSSVQTDQDIDDFVANGTAGNTADVVGNPYLVGADGIDKVVGDADRVDYVVVIVGVAAADGDAQIEADCRLDSSLVAELDTVDSPALHYSNFDSTAKIYYEFPSALVGAQFGGELVVAEQTAEVGLE